MVTKKYGANVERGMGGQGAAFLAKYGVLMESIDFSDPNLVVFGMPDISVRFAVSFRPEFSWQIENVSQWLADYFQSPCVVSIGKMFSVFRMVPSAPAEEVFRAALAVVPID